MQTTTYKQKNSKRYSLNRKALQSSTERNKPTFLDFLYEQTTKQLNGSAVKQHIDAVSINHCPLPPNFKPETNAAALGFLQHKATAPSIPLNQQSALTVKASTLPSAPGQPFAFDVMSRALSSQPIDNSLLLRGNVDRPIMLDNKTMMSRGNPTEPINDYNQRLPFGVSAQPIVDAYSIFCAGQIRPINNNVISGGTPIQPIRYGVNFQPHVSTSSESSPLDAKNFMPNHFTPSSSNLPINSSLFPSNLPCNSNISSENISNSYSPAFPMKNSSMSFPANLTNTPASIASNFPRSSTNFSPNSPHNSTVFPQNVIPNSLNTNSCGTFRPPCGPTDYACSLPTYNTDMNNLLMNDMFYEQQLQHQLYQLHLQQQQQQLEKYRSDSQKISQDRTPCIGPENSLCWGGGGGRDMSYQPWQPSPTAPFVVGQNHVRPFPLPIPPCTLPQNSLCGGGCGGRDMSNQSWQPSPQAPYVVGQNHVRPFPLPIQNNFMGDANRQPPSPFVVGHSPVRPFPLPISSSSSNPFQGDFNVPATELVTWSANRY